MDRVILPTKKRGRVGRPKGCHDTPTAKELKRQASIEAGRMFVADTIDELQRRGWLVKVELKQGGSDVKTE
jgi:hypothetical protein